MQRPLLLLDIDGVISLFGFDPARRPAGRFLMVDGIAHYLSAGVGEHLRTLGGAFELAWCSGWEEKAEEYLPYALELPAGTRYLTFEAEAEPDGRHWKLASIDRYAGPQNGRWRGSMTPTTKPAFPGPMRVRPRRCWSGPTQRSALPPSTWRS